MNLILISGCEISCFFFLNGELEKKIYMNQTEGCVVPVDNENCDKFHEDCQPKKW